jgi:hypothetical protein
VEQSEEVLPRPQPARLVGKGLDRESSPLLLDVDGHPAPAGAGVGLQPLPQRGPVAGHRVGGRDGDLGSLVDHGHKVAGGDDGIAHTAANGDSPFPGGNTAALCYRAGTFEVGFLFS